MVLINIKYFTLFIFYKNSPATASAITTLLRLIPDITIDFNSLAYQRTLEQLKDPPIYTHRKSPRVTGNVYSVQVFFHCASLTHNY